MRAHVEILSGIVRVGEECNGYGSPYDFAVAFSCVDGKTAIIKALTKLNGTDFRHSHAMTIIRALHKQGLEVDWERIKCTIGK